MSLDPNKKRGLLILCTPNAPKTITLVCTRFAPPLCEFPAWSACKLSNSEFCTLKQSVRTISCQCRTALAELPTRLWWCEIPGMCKMFKKSLLCTNMTNIYIYIYIYIYNASRLVFVSIHVSSCIRVRNVYVYIYVMCIYIYIGVSPGVLALAKQPAEPPAN